MRHLIGQTLPNTLLRNSNYEVFNPSRQSGRAIYFCYPYTGRPGVSDPLGWDDIVGAHGSTPQALGFARLYLEFQKHAVEIFGLSLLSEEWIADFAQRNALPYKLISDEYNSFSRNLNLPRFKAGDKEYLTRITLITENAIIKNVLFPITNPAENAAECLAMFA
jgi:peroxiredoxin